MPSSAFKLLVTSYLEPEHIARLRSVDERIEVMYKSALVPPPRFPADHTGGPFNRTPADEARWRGLLSQADILFDFDPTHRSDLPELAPQVRWIQATSAGIGQFIKRNGYDVRMPGTIFTTASGVHAGPLAEFCLMAILMRVKGAARMAQDQAQHRWERYAGSDLAGRTLAVIGLGKIGSAVAHLARAAGLTVIGTNTTFAPEKVDRFYAPERLDELLVQAEFLVLAVPHTPATEGLIGPRELALLPRGAYLINIARGAVVDEQALIAALRSGQLGGAALDVFAVEPLPSSSPLWDLPDVLISPHSASTSDRENERITDLFCDNLRRFLAGEPLRNVLNVARMY